MTFRTVVLWIHLAAVIVWVGGLIVMPFVVAPAIRRLDAGRSRELLEALSRRFLRLSRELVLLILLSGIFNVISAGAASGFSYGSRYLIVVGIKFGLLLVMAANQAWSALVLAPRGETRLATWSAAVNILLAAVALYLALTIRFG